MIDLVDFMRALSGKLTLILPTCTALLLMTGFLNANGHDRSND